MKIYAMIAMPGFFSHTAVNHKGLSLFRTVKGPLQGKIACLLSLCKQMKPLDKITRNSKQKHSNCTMA